MNYGAIKKTDIANGAGVRVSLFVSGCRHRCENCFNEVAWDFEYGDAFNDKVFEEVIEAMRPKYISGLSILGGEPFEPENQRALLPLVKKVKENLPGKDIWVYSGFEYDTELIGESRARCEVTDELLSMIDILVDGRYVESEKDITLKFRGSRNQRIIDVPASLVNGNVVLAKEYN